MEMYLEHSFSEDGERLSADGAPDDPEVWNYFLLGLLLEKQGDRVGAGKALAKAAQLAPRWPLLDYHLGRRALDEGNSKGALPYLENAVRAEPDWQGAGRLLAEAYAEDGQHERAFEYYDRLVERSPDQADALMSRGRLHGKTGDTEQAARDLQAALELADDAETQDQIRMTLAQVLIENRQFDEAIKTLVQVIGDLGQPQERSRYEPLMLLAEAHEGRNDRRRAASAYRHALREQPESWEARFKQALNAGLGENKWAETRTVLEQLCDEAPEDYRAWLFCGIALTRLEEFEAADKSLSRAHELAPGRPEPIFQRGRLLNNRRRYEAAEDVIAKLDQVDISSWTDAQKAALLHQKAVALCGQKRYGEAEAILEDSLALASKAPVTRAVRHMMALVLVRQGRLEEAKEYLARAQPVHDSGDNAFLEYARCLAQDGRLEEAIEVVENFVDRLVERNIDSEARVRIRALEVLCEYLTAAGRREDVWERAGQALDTAAEPLPFLLARASVAMENKQFRRALPDLRQAVHLAPENLEALSDYGRALLMTNQTARALEEFLRVLKKDPDWAAGRRAELLKNLGLCYLDLEGFAQAEDAFKRALDQCDKEDEPEYSYLLALAVGRDGRRGEMKAITRQIATPPRDTRLVKAVRQTSSVFHALVQESRRWLAPFQVRYMVIFAMIMRETRTRFGRRNLGYLWALVEPLIHVCLFYGIFTARGMTDRHGMALSTFLITGILGWFMFNTTMSRLFSAIKANKALLYFPQVLTIDLYLSRAILEFATMMVVFVLQLSGAALWGDPVAVDDYLMLVLGFLGLWALGLGFGLFFGSIISVDDGILRIIGPVFRIMYFTSGVFFVIDDAPVQVREFLLLNPVLHLIEFVRTGFFSNYQTNVASAEYVMIWILGALGAGIVSHWMLRKRIDLT